MKEIIFRIERGHMTRNRLVKVISPSRLVALAFMTLVFVLFQNCQQQKFSPGKTLGVAKAEDNGRPYDGKIYADSSVCPDGGVKAEVQFISPTEALITRWDCQTLQPPKRVAIGDIEIAADGSYIVYNSQKLFDTQRTVSLYCEGSSALADGGVSRATVTYISMPGAPNSRASVSLMVGYLVSRSYGWADELPLSTFCDSGSCAYGAVNSTATRGIELIGAGQMPNSDILVQLNVYEGSGLSISGGYQVVIAGTSTKAHQIPDVPLLTCKRIR